MNVTKRAVIIDFDSTLFDLVGFVLALPTAVLEVFGAKFGMSAQDVAASIKQFYVGSIGYDVHAHLLHFGVELSVDGNEQQLIDQVLAVHEQLSGRTDLLFPDVPETLARLQADPLNDVYIMSVNLQSGFDFKRRLCGRYLDGIPAWVVEQNKGTLLAEQWANGIIYNGVKYASVLAVDDNPAQINAVPARLGVDRVQILRDGQKYPRTNDAAVRVITAFSELR